MTDVVPKFVDSSANILVLCFSGQIFFVGFRDNAVLLRTVFRKAVLHV
jgi:hypothetical protein